MSSEDHLKTKYLRLCIKIILSGTGVSWLVDGTDEEEEGSFVFHTNTSDTVYLFWHPDEPSANAGESDCILHSVGQQGMYDVRCDIQHPNSKALCEAGQFFFFLTCIKLKM